MELRQWLVQEWANHLGPALSSMSGEPFEAAVMAGPDGPPPTAELAGAWRLREFPQAEIRLIFEAGAWQSGGMAVLRAAGIGDADETEARNAFLEVVEQSLGQLAAALGRKLGREVSWERASEPSAENADSGWAAITLTSGGAEQGRIWMWTGPGFALTLPASPSTKARDPAEAEPETDNAARQPMLDLLLDVELPVGVTFGRTRMKLKDAIKLTSGSIVELNRSIIEPVEVIVNNCVIARGEVVVIEGNYGVRIQEIVSREERLRTLF